MRGLGAFSSKLRHMKETSKLILIEGSTGQIEVWGQLTDLCRSYPEFSYTFLSKQKFPFGYKGFTFVKIPYRRRLTAPFTPTGGKVVQLEDPFRKKQPKPFYIAFKEEE